jgi:hypothetical protein
MTARKTVLVTIIACGCGSGDGVRDDAGRDARLVDASTGVTRVEGTLGGTPFVLKYAASKRGTTADPRHWICVADIPITYSVCEQTGMPERTMFLGPFTYDQNGLPKWAFPQVWLYRVGTNVSSYARSGTLAVSVDDEVTGSLSLSLNVDFGEPQITTGTVVIAL